MLLKAWKNKSSTFSKSLTEVFRAKSIDEVQSKCDQFFALMPKAKPE
jgi:hypothetical protein